MRAQWKDRAAQEMPALKGCSSTGTCSLQNAKDTSGVETTQRAEGTGRLAVLQSVFN